MTMIVTIRPKRGRVVQGSIFPLSPVLNETLPSQGGLVMPADRTSTVYRHPNARQKDVSTHQNTTAQIQQAANSTTLVDTIPQNENTQHAVQEIGPHERGKFFPTKIIPVHKTQFGADGSKQSNTAFHKRPQEIIPRSMPVSAVRAARHNFYPSFVTNNNLWGDPNNSFLGGRHNSLGQGNGSGRWTVTKRSFA
jgi:hypothetical protein